jgi:hypothetical protein
MQSRIFRYRHSLQHNNVQDRKLRICSTATAKASIESGVPMRIWRFINERKIAMFGNREKKKRGHERKAVNFGWVGERGRGVLNVEGSGVWGSGEVWKCGGVAKCTKKVLERKPWTTIYKKERERKGKEKKRKQTLIPPPHHSPTLKPPPHPSFKAQCHRPPGWKPGAKTKKKGKKGKKRKGAIGDAHPNGESFDKL